MLSNKAIGKKYDKESEYAIGVLTEKMNTAKQRMSVKKKNYTKYCKAEEQINKITYISDAKLNRDAINQLKYLKSIFVNLYAELQYHRMKE